MTDKPTPINRAERRRRAKTNPPQPTPKTAPIPAPGEIDMNHPDAPEPTGLSADVFNIAALVNTVKATFRLKEETALKTVDLAITILLTSQQMKAAGIPMGAKILTPDELAEREKAAAEAAALDLDSAPETKEEPTDGE